MSVWTAPVTTGGSADTITAKPTSAADMAIIALEYSGLSTVADITAVDQVSHSVGSHHVSGHGPVAPPRRPPRRASELAVGFYADSGFGDTLAGGLATRSGPTSPRRATWRCWPKTSRLGGGATPAASAQTGAKTVWLMATVVFASSTQSAPGAPTGGRRQPGQRLGQRQLERTGQQRQPHHELHRSPRTSVARHSRATVVTGSPPATTAVVPGLSNGTTYTFTVAATNAIGTGPQSAPTGLVTPSPQPQGQWSAVQNMPMEAISSILMDNGNFIFWDGWQQPEPIDRLEPGHARDVHHHQRPRQRVL